MFLCISWSQDGREKSPRLQRALIGSAVRVLLVVDILIDYPSEAEIACVVALLRIWRLREDTVRGCSSF
jgi:hypothetical protein